MGVTLNHTTHWVHHYGLPLIASGLGQHLLYPISLAASDASMRDLGPTAGIHQIQAQAFV